MEITNLIFKCKEGATNRFECKRLNNGPLLDQLRVTITIKKECYFRYFSDALIKETDFQNIQIIFVGILKLGWTVNCTILKSIE